MKQPYHYLLLSWLGLLSSACGSPPPDPQAELHPAYTILDQGARSGLTLSKQLVIGNAAQWQELWGVHQSNHRPARPLPPIDFSKEMIIAIFLGEQPTGGHQITIHDLQKTPARLQVNVSIDAPDKDAVVTMALTQPFIIIKTARTTLPVEFGVYTTNQ